MLWSDASHVTLLANFEFCLCLRVKFHKSLFWVPILAAGGPYWVPISQKVCPYFKAWGSLLVFASVQLFNWRWPSSFISTTFLSMICSLYTVHTCLFEIQTDTRAEQDYYSSRTCSAVHRPQGYKRQSGKIGPKLALGGHRSQCPAELSFRQIKLIHCCIHADWIDILRVNEAKTLKIGTLKYK